MSTYLKAFNLDLEEELNKIKDDSSKIAAHELEKEQVVAITKFARAKDMASDNTEDDDFSKSMEKAIPIAQEIINIANPEEQKKALMEVRGQDPAMYEQIIHYMNQYMNTPTTAGGMDPNNPNAPPGAQPGQTGAPPGQPDAAAGAGSSGDSQGDPTNNPGAQQPQGN